MSPELLPGMSPRHQVTQGGKGGPGSPLLASYDDDCGVAVDPQGVVRW